MIKKKILVPNRIRRIQGGFSFIPHRFLTDGFLASLSQTEMLLYLFFIIVSDRNGLSFYSYDAICTLLELNVDQYIEARNALIKKDLIVFDGTLFQVLDLPGKPAQKKEVKFSSQSHRRPDIRNLIQQSIREI
ncbi:MAG: helix-turn-helix domain-containing protein [Thermodesulfobacteriota bacterium]|nr:helix-turn-helix domain-containing protein [Thermodesulfobacteriota bacterium]